MEKYKQVQQQPKSTFIFTIVKLSSKFAWYFVDKKWPQKTLSKICYCTSSELHLLQGLKVQCWLASSISGLVATQNFQCGATGDVIIAIFIFYLSGR